MKIYFASIRKMCLRSRYYCGEYLSFLVSAILPQLLFCILN
uniref:Uncharacterized protein n=1 Tax=Arundo donax TaxID=35708 RepID=A0A0A8ZC20_ARUDO